MSDNNHKPWLDVISDMAVAQQNVMRISEKLAEAKNIVQKLEGEKRVADAVLALNRDALHKAAEAQVAQISGIEVAPSMTSSGQLSGLMAKTALQSRRISAVS